MQEVFYEESVAMHDEKPAKRRYTVFTVTAVLCIVFAFFSFINFMFTNIEAEGYVINLVIWGVMFAAMVAGAIFLFIKRHSFFLSYDYTFVSGELRISKVLHNRKRKLLYRITDDKLILIGRVDSATYKKLKAAPENKEEILTPNSEAEEGKEFYYIQAATNAGKRILIFECRQQMISTILHYVRRNILESEFNRQTVQRQNTSQGGSSTKMIEVGRCPNCGGKMKENERGYVCPYCHTHIEER